MEREEPTATGRRRCSVAEAADILGTSVEGVRGRIKRGTLKSVKDGGAVYVLLPTDQSTDRMRPADDQASDRTDLLISELQDRVRSLEEANRENRRIIAALTQRIPAIEAPQEPSEAPETGADEQQGRGPVPDSGGPQEPTEDQRGWFKRFFGFD